MLENDFIYCSMFGNLFFNHLQIKGGLLLHLFKCWQCCTLNTRHILLLSFLLLVFKIKWKWSYFEWHRKGFLTFVSWILALHLQILSVYLFWESDCSFFSLVSCCFYFHFHFLWVKWSALTAIVPSITPNKVSYNLIPCFTCQKGLLILLQFWVLIDISP